jgi:hypothetical protein
MSRIMSRMKVALSNMHEKLDILQHWRKNKKIYEKAPLQSFFFSFYIKNLGTIFCFHII